jgi:predicted anti-sigma-YlaC factor YlaD
MRNRHVSDQIAAHLDGELAPEKARLVELHLAGCARCRVEREQVRFGISVLDDLPSAQPPDSLWASIESGFPLRPARSSPSAQWWRPALAALAIVSAIAYWKLAPGQEKPWKIEQIHGEPSVDSKLLRSAAGVGAGDWIETDSSSSATVRVGRIGSVEVAPNTRLLIVATKPGEHRLSLARGEIRARISAPPRLFFVDTASGTAVDLGCEYTLDSDEKGSGLLRVTKGWVSFQWKGQESLVPAGASCRTFPHAGPGIPYFDDAPEDLKQALESFATAKSLDLILASARVRDTLTLWHLLQRVDLPERGRVYDRIAALTPVPSAISRQRALDLDPDTLTRWQEELAWTW